MSGDNSIAAISVRVVSVVTLVWTIRTILISSFKALVSQAHRTGVKACVFLSELRVRKEATLGNMALTEW